MFITSKKNIFHFMPYTHFIERLLTPNLLTLNNKNEKTSFSFCIVLT